MEAFLIANGFWVIVVGLPTVGWILQELMRTWRKARESEHLTALKQSMVERGMSVEEMEQVIALGRPRRDEAQETVGERRC